MKDIYEYITLAKEDRQRHIRINEPCIERGGPAKGGLSSYCKGLMAHLLDTSIPTGHKIHICHICSNHACSNPSHLYWGTARENRLDQIDSGNDKTIWQRTVEKHGLEKARQITSDCAKGNSRGAGNHKPKTDKHRQKIAESVKLQ